MPAEALCSGMGQRQDTKNIKDTKATALRVSHAIIGAAIEVHRRLGPGLLETTYETCLYRELRLRGLRALRQVRVPVDYRGEILDCAYRLDLLVEGLVIVEVKAVERIQPVHRAQVLTYLRQRSLWLGLLINFNVDFLRYGVRRILNG